MGTRLLLPRRLWNARDATTDWEPHARLGWVQKAHLDLSTEEDAGQVRFQTNADGLTPPTARRERTPGVARILMLGDSTVVGRLVPQGQTVHHVLEQRLQDQGRQVEVYNAGVEGYSTDQELLRLEELLPLYQPDLVFLVVCENDFGGNACKVAYGLNKPYFLLDEHCELREVACEPNAGILDTIQTGSRRYLTYSALYRLLRPRISRLTSNLRPWEQRNLEGLASDFYFDPQELERIDWKLFTALVRRMGQCCAATRSRLVIYGHPSLAEVWQPYIDAAIQNKPHSASVYDRHIFEKRLAQAAHEAEVGSCPLIDCFVARQERGPFHLLPLDPHCNAAGYAVTAEALAEFLMAGKWLP